MNLRINLILLLAVSAVVARDESKLFMFAKHPKEGDVRFQCVIQGEDASSEILWSPNHSKPTTECFFKPGETIHWDSKGKWEEVSALDWSLPPLLSHYRLEKMRNWTTRGDDIFEGVTNLPKKKWTLGVSVFVDDNAQIYLCDEINELGARNCYWIIINGWPEDDKFKSTIRRCNQIPNTNRDCLQNKITPYKGRIGQNGDWIHLKVDWIPENGHLTVSYRDIDNTFRPFLNWVDPSPYTPSKFASRSWRKEGKWFVHDYKAMGLLSSDINSKLQSKPLPTILDNVCISFFYITYPYQRLRVTLVESGGKSRELGVMDHSPESGVHWRGKQFKLTGEHLEGFTQPHLVFDADGSYSGGLSVVIDSVSVSTCNPEGDIRVSTMKVPSNGDFTKIECYLKQNSSIRVTWQKAKEEEAEVEDILSAGHLCSQLNSAQACRATILCSDTHCGCTPGYWAAFCRPACGQYNRMDIHTNHYGPGCRVKCGECKDSWTPIQRCHHITGVCKDSVCVEDYRPPMCKTRFLKLRNYPELTKAEPTTLVLKFDVADIDGDGTLASLEVQYKRTEEMMTGGKLLNQTIHVTDSQREMGEVSVSLTELIKSTSYNVRAIAVDTEGGQYSKEKYPGFKAFTTTCKDDLQLKWELDEKNPRTVALSRKDYESESSCGIHWYTLKQTYPQNNYVITLESYPVSLSSLKPHTDYKFDLMVNERSVQTIEFKTLQDAPSKVLYLEPVPGEDSIELTWKAPEEPNGEVLYYIVTYQFVKYLACKTSENSATTMSRNTTETNIVIDGLTPYSEYEIEVKAVTNKPGPEVTVTASTQETRVPGEIPQEFKVEPDTTSVTLSWSQPECQSIRSRFKASIRARVKVVGISLEVPSYNQTKDTEYQSRTFWDLEPFSHYNATVQFVRPSGIPGPTTYQDFSTKPSKPPPVTNLTVFESFNDSLTVRWATPPPPLHGELEAYTVQYRSTLQPPYSSSVFETLPMSTTTCQIWPHLNCYTIRNLKERLKYTIQVSARNKDVPDEGPTTYVYGTTREEAPSEPLDLTYDVHADKVTLTWQHPYQPNGRIRHFNVRLTPTESWLQDKSVVLVNNSTMDVQQYSAKYSHTVNNILPSTTYTVNVTGVTVEEGPGASLQLITPLAKADFSENSLRIESRTDTDATISIPIASRQLTNESFYYVVVVPDKYSEERSKASDTLNTSPAREEILANIDNNEDERARAWIAAKIQPNSESIRFVIGQDKSCCNYNLHPDAYYDVYVVVLNQQGREKRYSVLKTYIASTMPTSAPVAQTQNGGLYALLLLLAFPAVGIYLLYKYKLKNQFGGNEQLMLYPSKKSPAIDMPSVTKPACPEPSPSPDMGPRALRPKSVLAQSLSLPVPVPVPVPISSSYVKICDLSNYVHRGLLTGDLQKQHEMFPRGQTKPWDYGRLAQNKQKNRYGNLIAYDDTRVVLDKLPDDPFSDYINANYIDGYRKPRMYIATQGPRLQTTVDFWRMVWQERVQVIAMLTNVVENGKAKCEQYWPDSGKEVTYGLVTVLTGKGQVFADYTFRHFHLRSANETRKVLQLHFTSWPDHGVPLYPQSVASYLKKLLATPLGTGPMLVHCSAGVGRTGTIVVADACLRMAASEGAVDVLSFLKRARECRANMVDNYEQYKLIHLVLIECLVTESTALQCDGNFASTLKMLKESGGISKLYEHLDKPLLTPVIDQLELDEDEAQIELFQLQERERRQHKNRVQDIVPGSSGRVFLSRLDVNDPDTDYINAVSVDGFRIKDQFIATQFPLKTTTADFWRLVAEKQVSVVVALNEVNLADETVCMFWPIPGDVMTPTSYITVILKEEFPRQHWTTRHFLLIIKSETETQVREWQVTMLHLIGWHAGDALPKTTPNIGDGLLELWQETERVYSGDNPIIVCCYNGASACGLFLALSFLIEKMKLEQECDVVHAVRTVRHNRNQFIPSEMQFEWLYDAASTYLEAFETYANFH